MSDCVNKKSQTYLAFTMLGIFFVDLYLVLTKYADDFKESIKYKVNIKIEENKFHENVPAPRIVVQSDADRRSAYIPTLIPLLTGDNIYSSKVVFARELIQNSIDAISVREAKDDREFSEEILIDIKADENGKRYFKIVDRGTGMDRYKIERHFTSIGRSFYSGSCS